MQSRIGVEESSDELFPIDFLLERAMSEEEAAYRTSPLESRESFLQRRRAVLKGDLKQTVLQALRGYRLLLSRLRQDPTRDLVPFRVNLSQVAEWDPSKPIVLQKLFGWSDAVVLTFYETARAFYEEGNYQEAIDSFTFLTTVCPNVADFWTALAVAFEASSQIEKAGDMHQLALYVGYQNQASVIAAADFYRRQGRESAASALTDNQRRE